MTIQLADQLLNYVSSTIFLDVLHEVDSSPGVLLQLNGIQYAYNDRYSDYFPQFVDCILHTHLHYNSNLLTEI